MNDPAIEHEVIRRWQARASMRRIAEELRLLYVAMTRARDRLVLVGSPRRAIARRSDQHACDLAGVVKEVGDGSRDPAAFQKSRSISFAKF